MLKKQTEYAITRNGITLMFFKADPVDKKFSFRVKGNQELTDRLLADCKRKMIPERSIMYAVDGLFAKIAKGLPDASSVPTKPELDDTSKFVQTYQRRFGRSPRFQETHSGISVAKPFGMQIVTPDDECFTGIGKSKKAAKRNLAKNFLEKMSVPVSA